MAIPVLILGESGTGKTASLRNCTPDAFGLINVSRKPLPFRSALKPFNTDDYARITSALAKATVPSLVIDDSQYLMSNGYYNSGTLTMLVNADGTPKVWEGYNADADD